MKKIILVLWVLVIVSCNKDQQENPVTQQYPKDKVLVDHNRDAVAARKKPHPPKPPKGGGNGGGNPTDTIPDNPPDDPPVVPGTTCIYLSFEGEEVFGIWGSFYAEPSGLSFSQQDTVMTGVRNYYSNPLILHTITVTNSLGTYLSYPINKRMKVIVTNNNTLYPGSGGVAYVGSYLWADGTPSFVFPNRYNNNLPWVTHAVTHESGHMVGEYHQHTVDENCNILEEYRPGYIMGSYNGSAIWGVSCTQNDFTILNTNL